jgi:hypothetical protein
MGITFEYLLDFWRPPIASHQTRAGEVIEDEPDNGEMIEPSPPDTGEE